MNSVNPELDEPGLTASARIEKLFGLAPPVLVVSVLNFLNRQPGELDHHNLRMVAAAASAIGDVQLVARLIDDLPVTQSRVVARPIDVDQARREFDLALSQLPTSTSQRIVKDLLVGSTLDVLSSSPPDRVSAAARRLVEEQLQVRSRGSIDDVTSAVHSPFATTETIETALRRVERKVSNATEPVPFDVLSVILTRVFSQDETQATDQHVVRAWNLAWQCELSESSRRRLVVLASSSTRVLSLLSDQLIDRIEELESEGDRERVLQQLLLRKDLPETAARRAVASGLMGSLLVGSTVGPSASFRLANLRRLQYSGANRDVLLPDGMSSDDIDHRIASLPIGAIDPFAIGEMTNREDLVALCNRADLTPGITRTLITNRHLSPESILDLSDRRGPIVDRDGNDLALAMIVSNPEASDQQIGEAIERAPVDRQIDLLELAARNPASGSRVLRLAASKDDDGLLALIANTTPSADMQARVAQLAIRSDSGWIEQALLQNGTLRRHVADLLRDVDVAIAPIALIDACDAYGPNDIVDLLERGEIRPDVVDSIVDAYVYSHTFDLESRTERRRALWRMADAGLLSDHHWSEIISNVDRHEQMRAATHPNCPTSAGTMELPAAERLGATAGAIHRGLENTTRIGPPKQWSDLPNYSDDPLPRTALTEMVDGQMVDGLALEVPKTSRELDAKSKAMGNCLDGFAQPMRTADALVAWTSGADQTFAVAWKVRGARLYVDDLNTHYNTGDVPSSFVEGINELTTGVNDGTVQPVHRTTPSTHEESSATAQQRATHRRRPLRLGIGDDQSARPPEPPSLLANARPESPAVSDPAQPEAPDAGQLLSRDTDALHPPDVSDPPTMLL